MPGLLVGVESLRETERRVEIAVIERGGGAVARVAKCLRERLVELGQISLTDGQAMLRRIESSEERGEAPACLGPVRERNVEGDAARRERVDVGARHPGIAIRAEMIRAQGIDGDEQNVDAGVAAGNGCERRVTRRVVACEHGNENERCEAFGHEMVPDSRRSMITIDVEPPQAFAGNLEANDGRVLSTMPAQLLRPLYH